MITNNSIYLARPSEMITYKKPKGPGGGKGKRKTKGAWGGREKGGKEKKKKD